MQNHNSAAILCFQDALKYGSNSITNILKWYNENYKFVYDIGGCAFNVFKNNKELSFDEKYELGFYD